MRFLIGSIVLIAALGATVLEAKQCQLELSTPQPVLQAGKKQTACVKIGLKGFEMKSEKQRAPLNISLVIDRSGSMSGKKMERAKEAAILALQLLDSRDIVSIVIFDNEIEVLVPATKLTDRESVEKKIRSVMARGSTALYGGTEKGGEEVRKFFDKERVNRIILLSDGQANVGPSSAEELGKLGQKFGGEGISVTTFGLGTGYNEDLMAKLAATSDGNHAFIEDAEELADIFRKEFDTALSVVAQEIVCTVTLPRGVRPVRSLNMDVDIKRQQVTFGWNQIYSDHQRYVMLEVEVPATEDGKSRELASATVTYANMETNTVDKLSGKVEVKFSASAEKVKKEINKPVMEEYVELVANLENKRAMALRDRGDIKGAQAAFDSNAAFLNDNAVQLGGSARLERSATMNKSQGGAAGGGNWGKTRKGAVYEQNRVQSQSKY